MKFSKDGYKKNSKDKDNPVNYIKGGKLTMRGVSHPVMAIPYDKGGNAMPAKLMMPEQEYDFGGEVSYVMEIPYKKGGVEYAQTGLFSGLDITSNPDYQYLQEQFSQVSTPQNPIYTQPQGTSNVNRTQTVPQQPQETVTSVPNLASIFATKSEAQKKLEQQAFGEQGVVDITKEQLPDSIADLPKLPINQKNQGLKGMSQNYQFFNPYGGYDIPTAAYTLGTNIQEGDALGITGSAGKLLTGLGRNIVSGLGAANRNQFVLNEANQKRREALTQTEYLQEGGTLSQEEIDLLANEISDDIKFSPDWMRQNVERVQPVEKVNIPQINLGKYRDVGYFNVTPQGDKFILSTTEKNPHTADSVKRLQPYLQGLNPNTQLEIQYTPKMQEGGLTEEETNLLTGEYVTGIDNENAPKNVEVEVNEWMKFINGDVSKVMGNNHENGGEKMNVEKGTKVISDFTKIGKDNAKYFRDTHEIKVKATDTYAKIMDKLSKKLGISDLVEEEKEIISKVDKQRETGDSSTYDLNMQFLSGRLQEIKEEKKPLEEKRAEMFEDVFSKQEDAKKSEKLKKGGEIDKIAKKYGVEPEKAMELIEKYQEGGEAGEQVRILIGELGLKDSYEGEEALRILENLHNYDATEFFDIETLEGKGDNFKLTPKENAIALIKKEENTKNPNIDYGAIDQYFKNLPISDDASLYGDYDIDSAEQPGDKIDTRENIAPNQAANILNLPDQTPLPPTTLQPQLKGEVRLGRIEPTYISPEASLTELNRQLTSAQERLSQLPDSQRQAAIASMLANSQSAVNQATVQTEVANQQAQMSADQFNIGQRSKEDLLNLENALQYEAKIQKGMSNYQQSLRNFFNAMQQNQLGKYNEINRLNLLNQLYDNFQFTPQGVQQVDSAEFQAPNINRK